MGLTAVPSIIKLKFLENALQVHNCAQFPVLAGQIQVIPMNLSSIQQLIKLPTTAILSFYTTLSDTHIFVIRQNQITLHTCTGLGFQTLQASILTH